jgi:hypothetical protein
MMDRNQFIAHLLKGDWSNILTEDGINEVKAWFEARNRKTIAVSSKFFDMAGSTLYKITLMCEGQIINNCVNLKELLTFEGPKADFNYHREFVLKKRHFQLKCRPYCKAVG